MSKPLIKSRFLLGKKHLADLVYDKDAIGRGYLKISFKNPIADFIKGSDVPTRMPILPRLQEPINLELSYKFQDDFFSIKKIRKGKKPEYEFYKVLTPPVECLFYLKIKDLNSLDDVNQDSVSQLILLPPDNSNSVAVVFSFLNAGGTPLAPPKYSGMLMGCIDLPEQRFDKLCIGICPDPDNNEAEGIVIMFPYNP